ncbi:MAG: NADPH-dependent FMN reductase [Acidimicrobiales bacterium]
MPLQVAVLTGSTREGRFGPIVADWFVSQARERDDTAVDLIDLADIDLPAALPQLPTPAVRRYMARLDRTLSWW